MKPTKDRSIFGRQSYMIITGAFFLFSIIGQFVFSFAAGQSTEEVIAEVLANWQSEALQLCWQIGGLMFLLAVGSPQSREQGERIEKKLDAIAKWGASSLVEEFKSIDYHYDRD